MAKKYTWAETDMKKAVESVRNEEMGPRQASKVFNVPYSTIRDRVNARYNSQGKTTVLSAEFEITISSIISPNILKTFRELDDKNMEWNGPLIHESLFKIWRNYRLKHDTARKSILENNEFPENYVLDTTHEILDVIETDNIDIMSCEFEFVTENDENDPPNVVSVSRKEMLLKLNIYILQFYFIFRQLLQRKIHLN